MKLHEIVMMGVLSLTGCSSISSKTEIYQEKKSQFQHISFTPEDNSNFQEMISNNLSLYKIESRGEHEIFYIDNYTDKRIYTLPDNEKFISVFYAHRNKFLVVTNKGTHCFTKE